MHRVASSTGPAHPWPDGPVQQATHRKASSTDPAHPWPDGPVQQAVHSIAFSTGPEHLLPWWGQFSKQCTGKPLALAQSFHCCLFHHYGMSIARSVITEYVFCSFSHHRISLLLVQSSWNICFACSVITKCLFCLLSHHGMSVLPVWSSRNVCYACSIIMECLFCLFSHRGMSVLPVQSSRNVCFAAWLQPSCVGHSGLMTRAVARGRERWERLELIQLPIRMGFASGNEG